MLKLLEVLGLLEKFQLWCLLTVFVAIAGLCLFFTDCFTNEAIPVFALYCFYVVPRQSILAEK